MPSSVALWPLAALYALLWWILSPQAGAALAAGAVAVAAALVARARLAARSGGGLRWQALPRFAALFLWHSLRGGLDVARRAFSGDMRLRPACVWITLELREERARVLLALVVSLMPGTFAVRLEGPRLRLHVLDERLPFEDSVRRFEREVAALTRRP